MDQTLLQLLATLESDSVHVYRFNSQWTVTAVPRHVDACPIVHGCGETLADAFVDAAHNYATAQAEYNGEG